MVTTSQQAFLDLYTGLDHIIKKSVDLNGLFERVASKDRGRGEAHDDSGGDFRPFGY